MRANCGGCHAHSQTPTPFEKTRAAQPDYAVWDLVNTTPLVTDRARDVSKKHWDVKNEAGLHYAKQGPVNVEYFRDIQPILKRTCIACHTAQEGKEPAGNLNLDADDESVQIENEGKFPGTYARLAHDERAKFGHKPLGWDSWGYPNASRYIRKFQSRRSLLVWKIFGERLDGFSNDDHPSEAKPGERTLLWKGKEVDVQKFRARQDLDYLPPMMPPPDAVKSGNVPPLSDEYKRTLVRWIDLGCPIDLDSRAGSDSDNRAASVSDRSTGHGWFLDENRPTLAVTLPAAGKNAELTRLLIGMHDYGAGIDAKSFTVIADFAIDGIPAGQNLAAKFRPTTQGVWEYRLQQPIAKLERGKLTVAVADGQGNVTRVERTFGVGR
jgi:hypothetical protein